MSYPGPPGVAVASLAAVVGTAVVAVVAAPGAGFRHRLVGCQLGSNRAAGATCDTELRDGVNPIVRNYGLLAGGGDLTLAPPIPEPGIIIAENTAINFAVISSVAASSTCVCVVYFYTDTIT